LRALRSASSYSLPNGTQNTVETKQENPTGEVSSYSIFPKYGSSLLYRITIAELSLPALERVKKATPFIKLAI
jgi:hypothetical protein